MRGIGLEHKEAVGTHSNFFIELVHTIQKDLSLINDINNQTEIINSGINPTEIVTIIHTHPLTLYDIEYLELLLDTRIKYC
jgi:hypothetical protein